MISVVIPAFNAGRYLAECIESLINQTSSDWEAIVVDDGSTDRTRDICKEYSNDSRIRYVYKDNSGVTDSRWIGVKESNGDYVTFLDADDLLLPGAIESIANVLSDGVDVVNFKSISFTEHKEIMPDDFIFTGRNGVLLSNRKRLMGYILRGCILSTVWGCVYRRSLLLELQSEFCNGLKVAEDTFFNLQLVYKKSPNVLFLKDVLYGYRQNPDSVTHTFNDKRYQAVRDSIFYLKSFVESSGLSDELKGETGFRYLLLWSVYFFHPDGKYYTDPELRKLMRKHYFQAFPYLYNYLRVYLLFDLFISKRMAQRLFNTSTQK